MGITVYIRLTNYNIDSELYSPLPKLTIHHCVYERKIIDETFKDIAKFKDTKQGEITE